MKSPWKRRSLVTAIALTATLTTALSVALGAAHAATDKPMRIILPAGAGSGVDAIMRAASPSLSEALDGQPVLLENLPGAGGTTGTLQIVKAAPDGNTIGVVSNNHAVNPAVFKKMPFIALNDITPI